MNNYKEPRFLDCFKGKYDGVAEDEKFRFIEAKLGDGWEKSERRKAQYD